MLSVNNTNGAMGISSYRSANTSGPHHQPSTIGPNTWACVLPSLPPRRPPAPTMFPRFQQPPEEIRCKVWAETWRSRTVTITRAIVGHCSDGPAPGRTVKQRSRRRHRDKALHSNAVMAETWDGVPCEAALDAGEVLGLKYEAPAGPKSADAVGPAAVGAPTSPDRSLQVVERKVLSLNQRKMQGRDERALAYDMRRVTTITKYAGKDKNPVSLWVNHESREYTERFSTSSRSASLGMSREYTSTSRPTP